MNGPEGGVQRREQVLGVHVFAVSATLVGVCLTGIGLLHIARRLGHLGRLADQLLSLDAVLFLIACGAAYGSLRQRNAVHRERLERIADWIFLGGLIVMACVCAAVAFELV